MEGDVVMVPVDITPGSVPVLHKFGPKEPNHPTRGGTCLLCQERLKVGEYTTVIPLGPGNDEDAQAACRAGRPYHGIGIEAHWGCATGKLDIDLVMPN